MTTNIYVLADTSYKMQRHSARLTEILNKYARALAFSNGKAKLHIIGYNDKAKIIEPFKRIQTNGNPNLGEGLKLLESVVKYQRKYDGKQTRSVFILHIYGSARCVICRAKSLRKSVALAPTFLRMTKRCDSKNWAKECRDKYFQKMIL